jgi:hypothetical protein
MDLEESKCSRDRPNEGKTGMTNINDDKAEGMRARAREAEQKWRAERGFAKKGPKKGPLPKKRQPQLRPQPLERKEVERRQQRRQQRIERGVLRQGRRAGA